MIIAVVLACLLLLGATPAAAFMLCSAPSEPYCLTGFRDFDDESDFERCKNEVEEYVDDTRRYGDCLIEERNSAVKKANEAVERFNCKARRERFCP